MGSILGTFLTNTHPENQMSPDDLSLPIIVIGASGQLGSSLTSILGDRSIPLDVGEIDLCEIESIEEKLNNYQASALINAAGYTLVDRAETEADITNKINGIAPGILAGWCAKHGIPFVHYSTEYVFDGRGTRPWTEEDRAIPLNVYGRSKLEGERQTAKHGKKWLVFRTSWIFNSSGNNFVRSILRLANERESLSVVNDQYGAPTYAPHLAITSLEALENALKMTPFPSGIYHLCSAGETTWYDFTVEILKLAREQGMNFKVRTINPIPSESYPTTVKRPLNSRLNTDRAADILGVRMPDWREGLDDCMRKIL